MENTALSFEEADDLCTEVIDFLIDCGGVYIELSGYLQIVVLKSIATNQYIIYRDEPGNIIHFICYEFLEDGVLKILEHGNKEGRKGMTRIIKQLRSIAGGRSGVTWNSKGRGVKTFLKQKGDRYGRR